MITSVNVPRVEADEEISCHRVQSFLSREFCARLPVPTGRGCGDKPNLGSSVKHAECRCLRPFGTFSLVRSDTVLLDTFVAPPGMLYFSDRPGSAG